MSSAQQQRSAIKGLATVAMLKVNFDAGRDHIAMFEPFVLDAVAHFPADDLGVDDIRRGVLARHDLGLPVNTLQVLLGRIVKSGYLRREGGRYFRTEKKPDVTDLPKKRARVQARQERLARGLCEAGRERGVEIGSTEDALSAILEFLETYHVAMVSSEFGVETAPLAPSRPRSDDDGELEDEHEAQSVITGRFLQKAASDHGDMADILQEMLEGFVLQNTLLLKDISTATRRFRELHVVVDSGLLFAALGLRGPAAETATLELLSLLRETGAVLDIFEPTIREMRRVLAVYEERVGTTEGRLSLRPTELTRFILSKRLTPSDIRTRIALLEHHLRQLGFNIRELPQRVPKWTLDEAALGKLLSDGPGAAKSPRVVHDVDCIAGVLTYRRGKTAASLDDAGAIFVTSSVPTVRTANDWYEEEVGRGFPPIIHYLALSNFAWLKKPASAAKLKLHELVALCSAALRPSRAAWGKFVSYLRQLDQSGELSSDEITAIVASDLTDTVLVDVGIDEDSDASSLSEVVERVKASYKETTDAEVSEAKLKAAQKDAEARKLREHIASRAKTIAEVVSWTLAAVFSIAFMIGTVLSIIATGSGESPSPLALALAIVPLALAGLFGILWGFHVKAWRQSVEDRLAQSLTRWLAGSTERHVDVDR
jgi:hypothetical protein